MKTPLNQHAARPYANFDATRLFPGGTRLFRYAHSDFGCDRYGISSIRVNIGRLASVVRKSETDFRHRPEPTTTMNDAACNGRAAARTVNTAR